MLNNLTKKIVELLRRLSRTEVAAVTPEYVVCSIKDYRNTVR